MTVPVAIAGDHTGNIEFKNMKKGFIIRVKRNKVYINKETVESFEIIGEEEHKSFGSGVARGIAGAVLFGGIGAIAGAASAKKKGIHTVSIVFKDGTKSLCEFDDFFFKTLLKVLY